jgi:nicotinic acid mononucleotide adenylyltransferase
VANYRNGLIERIGLSNVEELESDQSPKNYTIDDLKSIKNKYKALARELEKAIG